VACLDRPTGLTCYSFEILVVDAGNRALRSFSPGTGNLVTITGPSRDPEFRYGLLSDGIQEPLPPGFAFAALGAPRALCIAGDPSRRGRDVFILSTEHRLASLGRGPETFGEDPAEGTTLGVEPPAAEREEAKGESRAERKEPAGAPAPLLAGPCRVRFRVREVESMRRRFSYVVQCIDADGTLAQVARGEGAANQEQVVPGRFTRAGKARVLLTWVTDTGYCAAKSVAVQVR